MRQVPVWLSGLDEVGRWFALFRADMSDALKGKQTMTSPRKTLLLVLLAAVGLGFTARPANADTVGYFLNVANGAISPPFTGPYALVIVDRTSTTTADVLFLSNTAAGYWFGDGGSVAVNTNGDTTVSSIAAAGCRTGTCATFVDGGAGNEDGFGSFNVTINATGGGGLTGWQGVASQISFTLTLTSGTWASAGSVLTLNDAPGTPDYLAAAHIFVGAANAAEAITTGFAASTGVTTDQRCINCVSTPDGGMTMSLLGIAMAGLGVVARRRK
jgi:hypothetical protein